MIASRRVSLVAVIAIGAIVLGWCGVMAYRVAHATKTCTYRITFGTMPAEDRPLADWLRQQPGVLRAEVSREGDTLVAVFDMRPSGHDPLIVQAAGERFGYESWQKTESICEFHPVGLLPW